MKDIKYKKIKLSPHTRDKIGLFARDYDKDLYVENDIWSPDVFEPKAYPEQNQKYFYFKFNQNVHSHKNSSKTTSTSARDKEIARLEAEDEKRYETEKFIVEQIALEKAQEKQQKENIKKAKTSNTRPTPPKPKTTNSVQNKKINKLNIEKDKVDSIK